jgi:pimeloyl-ACP methyl ester carboxylesterase
LNDVGPFIPAAALKRIRDYMLGVPERFPSMQALEAHLREVHAPFGKLDDAEWALLARYSGRSVPEAGQEGAFALHYDPKIAEPMRATMPLDVDLWPVWGAIKVPVLTIRGATSDLLLPETLERMEKEGAKSHIVPDAGHAPALMDAASIGAIRTFLLQG